MAEGWTSDMFGRTVDAIIAQVIGPSAVVGIEGLGSEHGREPLQNADEDERSCEIE